MFLLIKYHNFLRFNTIFQKPQFTAYMILYFYGVKILLSKFADSLLTNDPYKYKNFPKP